MYFMRRLKGGFEGNSHWIFTLMYINVHNLTIEGHANIYKCIRDDIPLICFGHCIYLHRNTRITSVVCCLIVGAKCL